MFSESTTWKIINTHFSDEANSLVSHHLESYNDFFQSGINRIFKENNPIRFVEPTTSEKPLSNECMLYMGGKDGTKIYFGKPIIYDDAHSHYMYPNDARLRNMTYGITIHYDVDVEVLYNHPDGPTTETFTLEKIYLGKFPIMLKSKLCVLQTLAPEVCFNMGECRNDYGGYFIIDGKEKLIIPQETFADNMLYVRKYSGDNIYTYSAEIRSVSEDTSKPIRTTSVKMVAPSSTHSNGQIVVNVPNVRKPIPLFIVMRALGVVSDKKIIETCILNMDTNSRYVDYFIPCVHDANKLFTQQTALEFIASFTKRRSVVGVLDILMNFFLPHVGVQNFGDKAYFLGYMVMKLLRVHTNEDLPTNRDSFKFKRIEQSGKLMYDLFREYYLIQLKGIFQSIDKEYYYHIGEYRDNFSKLIESNYRDFFKVRDVETGMRKAFKGNWGAQAYTKKLGIVQDVNRLSWNSFISQLRKLNLPLDASAKVVGPRHLNGTQWGFIDPVDTPDGGNIGLHKHMSITTHITSMVSSYPLIQWLRSHTPMKILQECNTMSLSQHTKMFVNGNWVGVVSEPLEIISMMRLFRRNGLIPVFTSISFDYKMNEIHIYTDGGRLTRPIYYIQDGRPSYDRGELISKINEGTLTWQDMVAGYKEKVVPSYSIKNSVLYSVQELYGESKVDLEKYSAVVEYMDTSEEESSLIAVYEKDLKKTAKYTHIEIHPSLLLGVLGNMVIYPEHNPYARNAFSCGQSKQAVSVYHTNFQMRIDKMGVILNSGQIPLLKSRYLNILNKEEQPYGVNAIVAIMSYTGYNVEDAILINQGAVDRGIFRTTYYSMYEAREESSKVSGSVTNAVFADVSKREVAGLKKGYDYGYLDKHGIVKENTELHDKMILIGKVTSDQETTTDASVKPKKGQLGYVDKAFLTDGEEGFRIAKVRIREERIPAIGDKMASRAGQKGTIGLIIPESDMPYTPDGIRPDLIINPHAIPSRMTIGQLIESLFGKACCGYGGFGDCTAFTTMGPNTKTYGEMLTKIGFHSSGNQVLYSGMTGEQLTSDIYIGPTYYMRLKHMVKDKINYRARGPNNALTRQSVHGRANDGGLRIGEMERDGVVSHGMAHFLSESFLDRADEYYMAVCNNSGMIAIYNTNENIFISPQVDGPIKFYTDMENKLNIDQVTKYGRSFSMLRIPYSFKLLMQELQAMNVQFRIVTEDNVDKLMSLSYSDNIIKLTDREIKFQPSQENDNLLAHVERYKRMVDKLMMQISSSKDDAFVPNAPQTPDSASSSYHPVSSDAASVVSGDPSPPGTPMTPPYTPEEPVDGPFTPVTPPYPPSSVSNTGKIGMRIDSTSSDGSIPEPPAAEGSISKNVPGHLRDIYNTMSADNKSQLHTLPESEQVDVLSKVYAQKTDTPMTLGDSSASILEVAEDDGEKSKSGDGDGDGDGHDDESGDDDVSDNQSSSSSSGKVKKVSFST